MKKLRGAVLLVITAIIWGGAFVAQEVGLENIGPFTFTALRFFMGGIALLIITAIVDFFKIKKGIIVREKATYKSKLKYTLIGGVCCGIALCIGSNLQQIGMVYTTAGKSAFISAFYIVIVPIVGLIFKRKCGIEVYVAVLIALVGLYLLCVNEGITEINKGDWITLISAIVYAFHILTVDKALERSDGLKISTLQCFTCGIISIIFALIFEDISLEKIGAAIVPLLYAGVISGGIAYTLQILGQRDLEPTVASLIMSLESVAGALSAFLIINQKMTTQEIIGCVVMFVAIILAQIPIKELILKRKNQSVITKSNGKS